MSSIPLAQKVSQDRLETPGPEFGARGTYRPGHIVAQGLYGKSKIPLVL